MIIMISVITSSSGFWFINAIYLSGDTTSFVIIRTVARKFCDSALQCGTSGLHKLLVPATCLDQ
jgi:hypothetical protein